MRWPWSLTRKYGYQVLWSTPYLLLRSPCVFSTQGCVILDVAYTWAWRKREVENRSEETLPLAKWAELYNKYYISRGQLPFLRFTKLNHNLRCKLPARHSSGASSSDYWFTYLMKGPFSSFCGQVPNTSLEVNISLIDINYRYLLLLGKYWKTFKLDDFPIFQRVVNCI